jgi:hypothetical protein
MREGYGAQNQKSKGSGEAEFHGGSSGRERIDAMLLRRGEAACGIPSLVTCRAESRNSFERDLSRSLVAC